MKDLYLESLYRTLEFIELTRNALQLGIVTDPEVLEKAAELEIVTYKRIVARQRLLLKYVKKED